MLNDQQASELISKSLRVELSEQEAEVVEPVETMEEQPCRWNLKR